MGDFFSVMLEEMGARRRRFRAAFGDRGQALTEFLTFAGIILGSLGLFLRPWMPDAAPWGFAIPFVFVIGHVLIEWRRQATPAPEGAEAAESLTTRYDWSSFLWRMACAAAGVAAFVIAWGAEPVSPSADEGWAPPEEAVTSTIVPEN
ncbi:hypothetical protein U91I_00374 [alpha proteobacterium U9-1i]|nr:hypothetical protein U91I_00374 [alpha proteobacterium U9-1i]